MLWRIGLMLLVMLQSGCSLLPQSSPEAGSGLSVDAPAPSDYYLYLKGLSSQQLAEEAQRTDLSLEQQILTRVVADIEVVGKPALTALLYRWKQSEAPKTGMMMLLMNLHHQMMEKAADNQELWQRNAELEQLLHQLKEIETHIQSRDNTTDDG
ncbi:hypothetical protein HMF8227_00346 [Saliniradius amylolyticus]|uniref:Uncharacterized protein n=2 Tax=Saliniradius amylolyticus TaxID=2183582 RepID=A0A2S2DZY7_9ALTE|nr:hypothetical protein HMF8227_00346 [Saliniradius amylolyticus]